MESLVTYLNCGRIYKRSNVVDFIVMKFSDIEKNIIPLFETHCPLVGNKNLEFPSGPRTRGSRESIPPGKGAEAEGEIFVKQLKL